MQFKLTIELGNEAMQTPQDVAELLAQQSNLLRTSTSELTAASWGLYDRNGNRVGMWEVIEQDVCIAGAPAENGRCGDPACVCALQPVQGFCIPSDELRAEHDALSPADRAAVDALPLASDEDADKAAEDRTQAGNTPEELDADALLEDAQERQTAYWDAVKALEEATGIELDGDDLSQFDTAQELIDAKEK